MSDVLDSLFAVIDHLSARPEDLLRVHEAGSGRPLFVSPAHAALWQAPHDTLTASLDKVLAAIHPDDRPRADAMLRGSVPDAPEGLTYRIPLPEGGTRWLREQIIPLRGQAGVPTLILAIGRDITGRHANECAALCARCDLQTRLDEHGRHLDDKIRQLEDAEQALQHSIVGIAFLTPQGRLRWANPALKHIFRVPADATTDTTTDTSLERYYPSRDEYLGVGLAVASAVARGEIFETELTMRRHDGSLFWAYLSGKAIDRNDLARGTVWAIIDFSQRHELETRLQYQSAEQEAILQSALVGIVLSKNRVHQWVNRAFAEMMGCRPKELIGQDSRILFPNEESWSRFGATAYPTLAAGKTFQAEWQMRRKSGALFWAQLYGCSVIPKQPDQGTIWTVLDISERKRAEEDIHRALDKQRQLNELKSRFIAMTSHEFRTPLATILSSAELLRHYSDRLPAEEKTEVLTSIEVSVRRMAQMLDNVLLIGRAEADMLTFRPVPTDIAALCRECADDAETGAGTPRHSRLWSELADDLHTARIDPTLLRHILGNLLSNALKYSPPDSRVSLCVRRQGKGLEFVISDRGIGIPEADLPGLFETFHRAGNVGNIQGTGLGLAIVRKSLDLHGGRIRVDSRVGQGTCFTVHIPDAPHAAAGEEQP